MKVLIIITILSLLTLIPDVRAYLSESIHNTRLRIFSKLERKSRINRNIQKRNAIYQRTARPEKAPPKTDLFQGDFASVSEELKHKKWKTTKQIFY